MYNYEVPVYLYLQEHIAEREERTKKIKIYILLSFILSIISFYLTPIIQNIWETSASTAINTEIAATDALTAEANQLLVVKIIPSSQEEKIMVSNEERQLLYRLVMAEAGSEIYEGQVAVANVVLNRVKSKKFPNTVKGVIYQKNQFTPVMSGRLNRIVPNKSVKKAVDAALAGEKVVPDDVVYFLNPRYSNGRSKRKFYKAIGNHYFFK